VLGADDRPDREGHGRQGEHRQCTPYALVAFVSHRGCRTWRVTQLDWIIVAFAAILGLLGFRQGFIVGVMSFAGFVLGAFLGTRLAPLLLPQGASSPYAPALGLVGALLAGAILASGLEGLGFRVRRMLVLPGAWVLDGVLGAVFGAALALGIVWILAAVAAQSAGAGSLRSDIQRSAILRTLNEILPPSGPILNALARLDPLPQVSGPSPNVSPPEPAIARTPGVRAAGRSVVRVVGTACGLAIEGSGWVVAPDLVVTNAHVVAGESDTHVEVGGNPPELAAQAVAFDPNNDVAVLHVAELGLSSLSLVASPAPGTPGAILGYPENGPFDVQPARIGATQTVLTQNAYGEGPIPRLLTPLRGLVRPGNSGGAVVDSAGRVLTTVFAGTVGSGPRGGYGVANQTVVALVHEAEGRERAGLAVGTGACASG
jgi:S1-C subfamily serine protease